MNNSELRLDQHEKAVDLHQRIITSYTLVQKNLWDMCMDLKSMRDEKLYKELGYSEFNDYTQQELNMTDRNVYRYISIAEKVNPKLVTSMSLNGMTKLSLLASLSDEQQHELSEKVNLEETTVKQLKAEIDKLKAHNKDLGAAKDRAVTALTSLEEKVSTLKEEKNIINNYKNKLEKDLEAKSAVIADTVEREKRVAEKLKEQKEENARLERENEELRNRPIDIAVVDRPIENDPKFKEIIRSIERENMKRNEEMDRMYIEDRRKLEADKQREINAIRDEYEKKLAEAVNSEPMDEDKLKFKIYLTSTYDMLNRLTEFTSQHNEPIYKEKIKQLLNSVLVKMED